MSKTYRYLILIFFLALLGFIIYPVGILPLKNVTYKLIYPLSNSITSVSDTVAVFFQKIKNIGDLTNDIQKLKDDNLNLESELIKLSEIEHENKILKEELGFSKEKHKMEMVPAQVVGRNPSGFLQTIKIDKGTNDGISLKQPVISQGYLIGVISEVTSDYSNVILITAANSLIPVLLQESRGTGLLQGGLQGLIVREITVDTEIKIGEDILSSGLGGDLLSGLPIGKVDKTISQESEIFQKTTIISPISFNRLEVVFVIK